MANSVASVTVTPTVNESNATVAVNGSGVDSGTVSQAITLTVGQSTAVNVVVTAQDGVTTKTYTIGVTRSTAHLLHHGDGERDRGGQRVADHHAEQERADWAVWRSA